MRALARAAERRVVRRAELMADNQHVATEPGTQKSDTPPAGEITAKPEDLSAYREWLVKSEHQASQDFDKAILTLAAGALGLSLMLIDPKRLSSPAHGTWALGVSWASLSLCLLASLLSLITSRLALRKTIQQVDAGLVRLEAPGGRYSAATEALNIGAAALLVVGVCFLVGFAWMNIAEVTHGSQADP